MKKLLLLFAIACLASCSTMKVATNVIKQYPVSVAPQDVVVYQPGDPMPPQIEELGSVTVFDDGSAKKEPMDTTLMRAKKAVSENGGNGLQIIDFKTPAESGSSNYQVYGNMLLTQGEPEVVIEVGQDTQEVDARASYGEFAKANQVRNIAMTTMVRTGHNIYGGLGYSYIGSKFTPADNIVITGGNFNNVLSYYAGYEYVTRNALSFGLGVNRMSFGCQERVTTDEGTLDVNDRYNLTGYMGTVGYIFNEGNVDLALRFGIGYGTCREIINIISPSAATLMASNNGLCAQLGLDILYKITETLAIGAEIKEDTFTFVIGDDREALQGQLNAYGIGIVLRASF